MRLLKSFWVMLLLPVSAQAIETKASYAFCWMPKRVSRCLRKCRCAHEPGQYEQADDGADALKRWKAGRFLPMRNFLSR